MTISHRCAPSWNSAGFTLSKASPHNSSVRENVPFAPSTSCKNLDLPPVNHRFLQSYLTQNSRFIALPHLCDAALKGDVTMSADMLKALSGFVMFYASYLAAFVLAGQDKQKSAYWAVLPAAIALAALLAPWQMLTYIASAVSALSGFLIVLYLSKRHAMISLAAGLLAISFCLSGWLLQETFLFGTWQRILTSLVYILLAVLVICFNITIFSKDYILTKEQKKSAAYKQIYFFPGLLLLIAWQIFLLTSLDGLPMLFHPCLPF